MIKKSNPSDSKKQKTSKASIFNCLRNSSDSDTQGSLISPRSDDDDIERDVSKKEASLKKFKALIYKNDEDKLKAFLFDKNNKYILHDAVEDKEQGLVEKILELAKYLTKITYNGSTVLHSAVKGIANIEIVKALLAKNPNLVIIKDASGLTPSHYNTSKEIAEILQDYERNVIDRIPVETSKYPIAEWSGWENDFEKYMGCKILVGQTDPNINSD